MSRTLLSLFCLSLALTLAVSPGALAVDFDFTVIATTDTQVPGAPTGTTFTNLPQPALRGGNIVFRGEGPGTQGIYAYRNGQLEVLADKNTPVPGDPNAGNFSSFIHYPSLDDSFNVIFKAQADSGVRGIYSVTDGVITKIVDTNTTVPNTSPQITFGDFSSPWISDGNVVFRGLGTGLDGIYTNMGGSLRRVAVTDNGVIGGTSIPNGTGKFTGFGKISLGPQQAPSIDGDNIAFYGEGSGGQQGIYAEIDGTLTRIADTNTLIPGGGGAATFPGFDVNFAISASTYDDGVVFVAGLDSDPFPNRLGIYKWWSGSLMKIVDPNTVVVGEGGNLTSFGEGQGLSFYNNEYSFLGDGSVLGGIPSPQGIYAVLNGQLEKVIVNNELVEGQPVGGMGSYGMGVEDGSVVFNAGAWGSGTANAVGIQQHLWLGEGSTVYGDPGTGSDWDDPANWPFGLLPRNVVPTLLTPSGDVTIHGPTVDATLDSLQVGGGAGIATLWMHGGTVLTAPSTTVTPTGVLAGNGTITGTIVNNGVISPDNISTGNVQNDALIELATASSRLNLGSSTMTNNGTLTGEGTLLTGGLTNNGNAGVATLSVFNTLTNNGQLDARQLATACIDNNNGAALVLVGGDALVTGDEVHNSGVLRGSGRIEVSVFENNSDGEVRVGVGDRMVIDNQSDGSNAGVIEAIGGELEFTQAVTNYNTSALILARNATLRFGGGGLVNSGAMAISFGTTDVFGDIDNRPAGTSPAGTIVLSGNSNTTIFGDVTNDGSFQVSSGSTVVIFGDFSGANGISGSGSVFLEGDLRPGNSPAAISFGGDLHLGALTGLEIELGGTIAGSEYDQVSVVGDATLGGTLDVLLTSGFDPAPGDSFEILTADNILGTFTAENLPALPGSMQWFVKNSGTSIELISAFAGDFDFDGDVDGIDFLKWQRGESFTPYSALDLTDWEANYGMVIPLSADSAAVPEPSTLALLCLGGLLAARRRLLSTGFAEQS